MLRLPAPYQPGAVVLAPLYAYYTRRLRRQVLAEPGPRHVAVILDGNRRWASAVGLGRPAAGHQAGADKLDELLGWCRRLGIEEVTVWALSSENLTRSDPELGDLVDVVTEKLEALASDRRGWSMRIRVVGRFEELPERLREAAQEAEQATSANDGLRLTIALAYSGRDELVDAARELVRELIDAGVEQSLMPERVTPEALARHLYTAGQPDPDLIIRTSGELRLSGFLPWQGAHSELYFSDVYWPAFREIDFLRALRSYQQRQRRYGR